VRKLSNISLADYKRFLAFIGCQLYRTKGGHEHWNHPNANRPITLQTHISPVPAFIIRQHLRYLNMTTETFLAIMDKL
jgi:predicted RNA binding protein YcfA (HicA-like mRNA interferase family)